MPEKATVIFQVFQVLCESCSMGTWLLTIQWSAAHFTKRFLTLCSLLNWFHHPSVLEIGEFFVSGSIFCRLCWVTIQHPKGCWTFLRLCRVRNVSRGWGIFLTLCLLANHTGWLTKSLGQRVRNVCGTAEEWGRCTRVLNSAPYVGCGIPHLLKGVEFLCETGYWSYQVGSIHFREKVSSYKEAFSFREFF